MGPAPNVVPACVDAAAVRAVCACACVEAACVRTHGAPLKVGVETSICVPSSVQGSFQWALWVNTSKNPRLKAVEMSALHMVVEVRGG